jgi:hypothetical protein
MDMKKILQALDGASSTPVQGSNDMAKFLSIVTEGKDTKTNRLTSAEQIAVQHYTDPESKVTTSPVLNKSQNEHMIKKYVDMVLAERAEELEAQKTAIKERAARVVQNMKENSVSEISGALRGRYAHKARLKQAGAEMDKFFNRDNPERVASADREIAKREKGLGMVKTRTDKWLASEKEKAAQAAIVQKQQDKENLPQLKAKLAQLKSKFDPNFEYSDDHTFWSNQKELQGRIHALQRQIHDIGEGDE